MEHTPDLLLPWELISGPILQNSPMPLGLTNWELYRTKDRFVHWKFNALDVRSIPSNIEQHLLTIELGPYAKWAVSPKLELSNREFGFDAEFVIFRPPGERGAPLTQWDEWMLMTSSRTLIYPRRLPTAWEILAVGMRGCDRPIRTVYWIEDWIVIRHRVSDEDTGVTEIYRSEDLESFSVIGTSAVSDETWGTLGNFAAEVDFPSYGARAPTGTDQQICATMIVPRKGSAPDVDQVTAFVQQRLNVSIKTLKGLSEGWWPEGCYTAMFLFNRRTLSKVRILHPGWRA